MPMVARNLVSPSLVIWPVSTIKRLLLARIIVGSKWKLRYPKSGNAVNAGMNAMSEAASGIVMPLGHHGVQRITIDRAVVGNSLSRFARHALTKSFLQANRDPAVRAVLLGAAGTRHFCAVAVPAARPADA